LRPPGEPSGRFVPFSNLIKPPSKLGSIAIAPQSNF
jgi:hypothetical protein